jgi:hypothetical protein
MRGYETKIPSAMLYRVYQVTDKRIVTRPQTTYRTFDETGKLITACDEQEHQQNKIYALFAEIVYGKANEYEVERNPDIFVTHPEHEQIDCRAVMPVDEKEQFPVEVYECFFE